MWNGVQGKQENGDSNGDSVRISVRLNGLQEKLLILHYTINMNGILGLFVCDREITVMVFDAITDPFDVFLMLNEENSLFYTLNVYK